MYFDQNENQLRVCSYCKNEVESLLQNLYDTRFGIKQYYSLGKCKKCNLIQTFPAPSDIELNHLYEKHYNFVGQNQKEYKKFRDIIVSSKIYSLWLLVDGDFSFHSIKGHGLLLDVGCNEGRGLDIYRKNGFHVEGLELNRLAAMKAKEKGFKVYNMPLENFDPSYTYDIVVLSNVLEHSVQPVDMLSKVSKLLKHGGDLWISCPNAESWQRYLFGKKWINWHVPFHLYHFSEKSLCQIVRSNGLKVKSVKHSSPGLWFAQSLISYLFAKKGKPTKQLRNPLLVACLIFFYRIFLFWIPWIARYKKRGDCLCIIAENDH